MKNFSISTISRGLFLGSLAMLAACQQMGPQRGAGQPASSAAQAQQQAAPNQAANANAITFHLAQRQSAQGLAQVQVNQDTRLYALPRPIFTQDDVQQVVPTQAKDGQTFVRFDFNAQGAAKLAQVAKEAKGNYFLISVRGRLIGVPQIATAYPQSQVSVSVNSAADANAIVQLIRQPQPPRTQPAQQPSGQPR